MLKDGGLSVESPECEDPGMLDLVQLDDTCCDIILHATSKIHHIHMIPSVAVVISVNHPLILAKSINGCLLSLVPSHNHCQPHVSLMNRPKLFIRSLFDGALTSGRRSGEISGQAMGQKLSFQILT
jgi:hypothetical protein